MCGDLVKKDKSIKCRECVSPERGVHIWCLKKAAIVPDLFKCEMIQRHFAPVVLGESRIRELEPLSALKVPSRFKCLVCGGKWENGSPGSEGNGSSVMITLWAVSTKLTETGHVTTQRIRNVSNCTTHWYTPTLRRFRILNAHLSNFR